MGSFQNVRNNRPAGGHRPGQRQRLAEDRRVAEALDQFGVPYEVHVMSAHRTPEIVRQYATMAAARGLRVIIAAAGGAAHLAGVVASHTVLPVIGIPVPTELQGGLDSLLSTVQMPGDVPVATVGVGKGEPGTPACWPCRSSPCRTPRCKRNSSPFGTRLVDNRSTRRTPPCKARIGSDRRMKDDT